MSHRHLATVLACCLVPALPGVAHAAIDKVDSIHISASPFAAPPVIHVANDGDVFTHVSAPVSVGANVDVDCKGANKVQDAHLVWGVPSIGGGWWEAGGDAYSGPDIPGTGGGSLDTAASMMVPAEYGHFGGTGIPGDPVSACNWALEARVQDGEPRWQILRDGFSTSGTHILSFAARCQFNVSDNDYNYWEYDSMYVDTVVQCEGNPDVGPPPSVGAADAIATPFQVVSATIGPDSSPIEQVCPAEVTLHGRIQANGAGDVAFRLIEGGAAGPVTQLHFTEQQTVFEFDVEVSVGAPPPGPDLGSFLGSSGSGNGGGIGDYQGVANGVHYRTVAIETLEPHAKVWTETHYIVICGDPQVNPDLGPMPDGLVPLLPEPFAGKLPAPGALQAPGAKIDGVLSAGMLGDDPASLKIKKQQLKMKKKILKRAAKKARKQAKARR
jgi:hypothetical protein